MASVDVESMYHNIAMADHMLGAMQNDVSWSEPLLSIARAVKSSTMAFRGNAFGVTTAGFIATTMMGKTLSVVRTAVRARISDLMDDILLMC